MLSRCHFVTACNIDVDNRYIFGDKMKVNVRFVGTVLIDGVEFPIEDEERHQWITCLFIHKFHDFHTVANFVGDRQINLRR